MREIKFRIFDNENKKFVSDNHQNRYVLYLDGDVSSIHVVGEKLDVMFYNKDTFTVLQYTGMKDCNGKDIYEGDILKSEKYGHIYHVKWDDYYLCFSLDLYCSGELTRGFFFKDIGNACQFETIGNIYENPELLNG